MHGAKLYLAYLFFLPEVIVVIFLFKRENAIWYSGCYCDHLRSWL